MKSSTLIFVSGRRALRGLTCAARKLAFNEVQRDRKTSLGVVDG
jgi:hypothetical protein